MRPICNIREFSKNEEHLSIKNEIFPDPIYQKGKILEYLQGFNPDCAAGMSLKDEITGQTTDKGVSGYSDEEGSWYGTIEWSITSKSTICGFPRISSITY